MEMIVIVNGKEEVREVDHLEVQPRGRMAKEVPVLHKGEKLVEVMFGPPLIVQDTQE